MRGEKSRKYATDQGTQEGQTGADDGDVAFGGGPVCGGDVAPGGVWALGDFAEAGETEDACYDDSRFFFLA